MKETEASHSSDWTAQRVSTMGTSGKWKRLHLQQRLPPFSNSAPRLWCHWWEETEGFFQFFNSFFFQFFFVVCLFFIHIFKCLTSVILSNISILFSYSAFRHQLRCSMLNISIVSLPLFECAYCLAALRRLWHLWKGQWVIGTRQRGRWRGEGDSIISWCSQSVSQSVAALLPVMFQSLL